MIRRFTSSDPCPICDGYQEAPRGKGIRCWGYLSEDRSSAFCTREEFAGSLGLNDKAQAFPHRLYGACLCGRQHGADRPKTSPMTIAASYDYTDESGNLLFQSLRYQPKRFSQRSPDGRGGWVNSLKGVRRVLYRLSHLLESDPDRWVFVVEGEKDVHALLELGMVATCNPMGAGKWQDEYSNYLKGRRVAVIPDNDPEGHRHAEKVVGSLRGRAASVKLVHLPGLGNKGDISDWLSLGNDVLDLLDLVEETPMYLPIPTYGHEGEVRLHVISMLAVQPRSVEWLWPGRIPKGKFTIIGGDPGLGKSFSTLDISSRVSQGGIWPDGGTAPRGNVLLITVEDDLEDTVYPRLQQLEADMSRVYAINPIVEQDGREVLLSLAEHLAALERVILEQQALLLVLDPLLAFTGRRTDTYRMSEVRAVLSPLAAMADRTRCAIVGVMHPNKRSSEMNSLYRMTSSLDFVAAARSVLAVGKHPMDLTRNVLASVKGNLSARPESLLFHIDDQGYSQWDGETDFDANAIMTSPSNDHSARAEAKEFLREFLAEGEVTANAVHEEADNRGIARATLYRAKMELKIGSVQLSTNGERGGRRWLWRLPPESEFS